ncbi:SRPBCC family protein [Embleya sp. NBC_00896]|uniref:SRPBCC family protein n=1 Tax=Embleya sp. NBC_00896 TaxID=2975961 RepID=UPI00387050C6|nr:SRPBCC family protein [Embleya sp. NBC_00896]
MNTQPNTADSVTAVNTVPDSAPIQAVDADAPVVVRLAVTIDAPLADVWALHTDIDAWADWNPDIDRAELDGPLREGARFRWFTHGLDIASTVYQVIPGRRIVWGGPAHGIDGVHAWTFHEADGVVTVRTDESWSGPSVDAQTDELRYALTQSLHGWLLALKARAERS